MGSRTSSGGSNRAAASGLGEGLIFAMRAEQLERGGTIEGRISSGSMAPLLEPGDRVVVRGLSGRRPAAGDLVLFRSEAGATIHRVIGWRRVGGRRLLLERGDANPRAAYLEPSACLGRVVAIEKDGARLSVDGPAGRVCRWIWAAASWPGAHLLAPGATPPAKAAELYLRAYRWLSSLLTRLWRAASPAWRQGRP